MSGTSTAPPSRSKSAFAVACGGWTGVIPARRATPGSGMQRATSVAGAISRFSSSI
jgi:hypothetical protein